MYLLQAGIQICLGMSALLTVVSGIPVAGEDANSQALSSRDAQDIINDGIPLVPVAVRDLSEEDLAKRAGPPTTHDFEQFFATEPQKSRMDKMVFWSGTGMDDSIKFARSHHRYTLEMLIGDYWKEYQSGDTHGYWKCWPAAITGFWDLASQACAKASKGEVFVYMKAQNDVDQQQNDPTRGNCGNCWYRKEKPALLANLGHQVTQITKYLTTNPKKSAGQIKSMSDKRRLV